LFPFLLALGEKLSAVAAVESHDQVFYVFLLFLAGFFGALITAIFLLVIKSCKSLFADRAFLFHSNHQLNRLLWYDKTFLPRNQLGEDFSKI